MHKQIKENIIDKLFFLWRYNLYKFKENNKRKKRTKTQWEMWLI